MSTTEVHAGRRMTIVADRVIKAGDLVYFKGFIGVVDDDANVGERVALILDAGVRKLRNVFGSTIPMGTKIFTYASVAVAGTTNQVFPAASAPAGAVAIGRAWATGVASSATATLQVAFFHPNEY